MRRKETLEVWIRQQVLLEREDAGRCVRLELSHIALGGKKSGELHSCIIPEDVDDSFISSTVNLMEELARGDVEGLGNVQTYAVFAYFEKQEQRAKTRYTFKLRDESETDDLDSEPPTKTGLIAQLMRHNEATMRTASMANAQLFSTMTTALTRLSEQNEQLASDKVEGLKIFEELYSQKHVRDIDLLESQAKQDRTDRLLGQVETLFPVILNKIGGNGKPKQLGDGKNGKEMTIQDKMLLGLVNSFTEEQMTQLQSVLEPSQLITLAELAKPFLPGEDKKEPDQVEPKT